MEMLSYVLIRSINLIETIVVCTSGLMRGVYAAEYSIFNLEN